MGGGVANLDVLRAWAQKHGVPKSLLNRTGQVDLQVLAMFTEEDLSDDTVEFASAEEKAAVLQALRGVAAWLGKMKEAGTLRHWLRFPRVRSRFLWCVCLSLLCMW